MLKREDYPHARDDEPAVSRAAVVISAAYATKIAHAH